MLRNWLTKKHKQRYSEWADKHNFAWAVGAKVPKEWLK